MRNQKRETPQHTHKFSEEDLDYMKEIIAKGQDELGFKPDPTQSSFMAYLLFYLDHQLTIQDSIPILGNMITYFREKSKDRSDTQWAVYHYYAHTLSLITDYFTQINRNRCGLFK